MNKIVEVTKVAPSFESPQTSPPPSETSLLPLTFFDILWLRLPPVQQVFFYDFPHQTTTFYDSVLPRIKSSLSLTLGYFFPLAGTLTWAVDFDKPVVKVTQNDAVSLTVAESDSDFHHLSGSDLCGATQVHHLLPHLNISHEHASVVALQITLFPNSGFSVGITSHHAVLDGKSSTSFVKSWSYLCKKIVESESESESEPKSLPAELVPSFDRGVVDDTKELAKKYLVDWLKQGGPNNRSLNVWDLELLEGATRGVFPLSRSNIERLKKLVESDIKGNKNLHVSTFVVSLAYAMVCRARAEEIKSNRVLLAINVDCRPRLSPPLPPTYFGNCVGGRFAAIETNDLLGENGLITTVEAISAALETLKEGVLSGAENWTSFLHDGLHTDDKTIGAAGNPRFEVYGSDFGWGRPKKVEMVSIDRTSAFCLSDSRDGDGVEIGFVSKKEAMETFASLFAKGLES